MGSREEDDGNDQQIVSLNKDELEHLTKSKFGGMVLQLENMIKKPLIEHDLSGILKAYLNHLNESEQYMVNGIMTMNFNEAALLIQSASNLYSKKVDLLYKSVLEQTKRIILYDKVPDAQQLESIENRIKPRRSRKKIDKPQEKAVKRPTHSKFNESLGGLLDSVANNTFKGDPPKESYVDPVTSDNFYLSGAMGAKIQKYTTDELLSLPPEPPADPKDKNKVIPENEFFPRKYYTINDYVIYKDDEEEVTNLSLLMATHMEMFDHYHWYDVCVLNHDPETILSYDVFETAVWQCLKDQGKSGKLTGLDMMQNWKALNETNEFSAHVEKYESTIREHSDFVEAARKRQNATSTTPLAIMGNGETLEERKKRLCPRRSSILVTRLPDDILEKYLRDCSESVTDDCSDTVSQLSTLNNNPDLSITEVSETPVVMVTSPNDSGIASSTTENGDNSVNTGNVTGDNGLTVDSSKLVHSEIDSGFCDELESTCCLDKSQSQSQSQRSDVMDVSLDQFAENCKRQCQSTPVKSVDRKRTRRLDTDSDENRSKRIRKPVFKLLPQITVSFRSFETFFCDNYITASLEGVIKPYISSENNSNVLNLEKDSSDVLTITELPNDENTKVDDSNDSNTKVNNNDSNTEVNNNNNDDSGLDNNDDIDLNNDDEISKELENTTVKDPSEMTEEELKRHKLQSVFEKIKESQADSKEYNDWCAFIKSKVGTEKESDFDIHEYGTKILDQFGDGNGEKGPTTVLSFRKVLEGKTCREVSRVFMATLQLVNAGNVGIVPGTAPVGQLANETMQLGLLGRERHHESLESYEAPSEVTYHEKLEKVKTIKRKLEQQQKHSKKQRVSTQHSFVESISKNNKVIRNSNKSNSYSSNSSKNDSNHSNCSVKVLNYTQSQPTCSYK